MGKNPWYYSASLCVARVRLLPPPRYPTTHTPSQPPTNAPKINVSINRNNKISTPMGAFSRHAESKSA
jgi:hypothetical protein